MVLSIQPLIFSIAPKWMNEILNKRKTVELRRRPPKIIGPVRAYLYETRPHSRIRVRCWMGPVISRSPSILWEECGEQSCVSKEQFDEYFCDAKVAHAIVIDRVEDLGIELTLSRLRQLGFSPPQAWCRATAPISSLVEQNA
jgi:predicted transcriptional regulator